MKIIEAMKLITRNKEKCADLIGRIKQNAAHLSTETPLYGPGTAEKLKGYRQAVIDITLENIKLSEALARTNLETQVTMEIGGKQVTRSITGWIKRRTDYIALESAMWQAFNDGGRREGYVAVQGSTTPVQINLIRSYDPEERDSHLAVLQGEKSIIDSTLEVVNATTDLIGY